MLESCGFHVRIGLRTLMDKALISIDSVVWMHDLIQSMAFEIVRQECVKNLGGRSRLWNPDEIYDVLKNNRGSDAIQGISLDLSQIRDLQLSSDAFRKMTNLRFLKFYSPDNKRSCTVNLPPGFESFFNSLRYLQWDNFLLESLPFSFCAEKLVELSMRNSHLKKLWDGVQDLVNLRKINLAGSKQLMELPDFSAAQNLELVNVKGCESLYNLHPSILSLPRLSDVELSFCKNLKSLKTKSQSKSITRLSVDGCYSLREFSFCSNKLLNLRLYDAFFIEILDFSIGRMEKLQKLSLSGLALKNLQINEICCMRSLQELHLYNCGEIIHKSDLHTLFDALLSLKSISLHGTCKTALPNNMKHLSRLESLDVSYCTGLQSLPELPPSIEKLYACNCSSLKTIQPTSHIETSLLVDEIMLGSTVCSSVSYLRNLQDLILAGCERLYELPEIDSLDSLISLTLVGSNVESLPASIKHLSNLKFINLSSCSRLLSLPELPPSVNVVNADRCISLEFVPFSIIFAPQLRTLSLENCLKLEILSLSRVTESAYFSLKRSVYTKRRGEFYYPGRKDPKWFRFNQVTKDSNTITIELPPTTNNLIGFIFFSVLSHNWRHGDLQCQLYCDSKPCNCSTFCSAFDRRSLNFDSHHVFLWCDPCEFKNFHKTIDDKNTNYRPKVSFKFCVVTPSEKLVDDLIEACGICPVYASEYHNFIHQMELQSNLDTQSMLKYASFSLKRGKCGNFERSDISKWFTHKSSMVHYAGLEVSLQLDLDFDNLIGFIFCFVMPHYSSNERDRCHSSCCCSLYDMRDEPGGTYYGFYLDGPTGWHYSMVKLNLDNVFLWYDPLYCECILQKLRRREKGNDEKLVFLFKFGDDLIKECGVHPLYISEYTNFLQQNKLKVSSMRTKRHWNIDDEQHQPPSTKKLKESAIIQSIPLNSGSKTCHDADELLLMLSQLNLESTKNHTNQKSIANNPLLHCKGH